MSSTMNTVDGQHQVWASMVMPKSAGAVQQREMKRAFYAGAEAALRIQFAIASPDVSEDAGVAMLEGMHDELRRFAAEIGAGRA